jgi:transposase, IS30 family
MKKYLQLDMTEREKIQSMLWEGKSLRCIAAELGRSPSSISREIQRNLPEGHYRYTPRTAELRAKQRIMERGRRPRLKDKRVQRYVVAKLKEDYSPEQIAGTLKDAYPDLSISHEAIYQFIYAQYNRDGYGTCIGLDLRKHLKRKHKARRRKLVPFAVIRGRMHGIRKIALRPSVVAKRSRFGDWEGDSMVSRESLVGLNTLVERKSGYLCISKLKRVGKIETLQAVTTRMQHMPKHLLHTLTLDNGKENASFKEIEEATGLLVYHADPYCPGQRGTNENTNGLIRHYLPKGTDFATVHLNTIRAIERKLNNRPRKRLGYKTPQQIFNGVLR